MDASKITDPTVNLDVWCLPGHSVPSKSRKVGAVSSSRLSEWKSPSAQSGQRRYIQTIVLNTNNINAHIPSSGHKGWLINLGCISAKGPQFFQ